MSKRSQHDPQKPPERTYEPGAFTWGPGQPDWIPEAPEAPEAVAEPALLPPANDTPQSPEQL